MYIKWFFVVFFVGVFGLLTSWLFYPLRVLTGFNLFWIWDDSTKYNSDGSFKEDYQIYLKGKETFIKKYKWHVLRNRVWNLNNLFNPKQGEETDFKFITDSLYRNDKKVVVGGKYVEFAGLKYKAKNGENPWQVNRGDEIDFKYSTIGKSFITYKIGDKKYFRYSSCKKHLGYWLTIKLGTNKDRFILTLKLQKCTK